MTCPTAHLPEPNLELRDDTPVSTAFGDVYFSRGGGIAETEHVFLAGNGLPERWKAAATSAIEPQITQDDPRVEGVSTDQIRPDIPFSKKRFCIGELGFGTGLNFLVAWKRFCETADADTILHYISIEKYPFTVETLRGVLALQPELATEAKALLDAYPLRLPGIHRIHLPRAVLTLCFGDVVEMLTDLCNVPTAADGATHNNQPSHLINAWFLDGFSPAKNPDMWSEALFLQLHRLSAPEATFATFTSAGTVRRGLQAAGFMVEKVAGFGHKRDMLTGALPAYPNPKNEPCVDARTPLGNRLPQALASGDRVSPSSRILLIGAGIAGATLANSLAQRGFKVTVLDRGNLANGASGNAAGVLFPQLTKQWGNSSAWYFTAYGFALRQLARWKAAGLLFASDAPGMLRLPRHAAEEMQLRALNDTLGLDKTIVHWLEQEAASAHAGITLPTGAAFFPQGTWISPSQCCSALLRHPNITLHEQTAAIAIMRDGTRWAITLANDDVITTNICCVTAAHESAALLGDYGIPLHQVGGQVSEIVADNTAANLRSIVCHKGYIIPQKNHIADSATSARHRYLIGATYHREAMHAVTDARHAENIAELNHALPHWFSGTVVAGRSSLRATTPDRLPYIGKVDNGLYLSTGHGSRGLLSAPLAAEIIASALCGELPPVSPILNNAVRPLRFKKP